MTIASQHADLRKRANKVQFSLEATLMSHCEWVQLLVQALCQKHSFHAVCVPNYTGGIVPARERMQTNIYAL